MRRESTEKKVEGPRKIPLSNGGFAIVDGDDYDYLMQWKWCRSPQGYAKRPGVYMHRDINQTPDGLDTDHIDKNKLNNMKSNLRTMTRSGNFLVRSLQKNNISGYAGVYFDKSKNKYMATIGNNKLGSFSTLQEAIKKRNKAFKEILPKTIIVHSKPKERKYNRKIAQYVRKTITNNKKEVANA